MNIRFLFLAQVLALTCGFVSLPLEKAANSSRMDVRAADGKGGWLDLGSNDLAVLPDGKASYAGVTFVVPPAGDEFARNCVVLGRKGAESVELELDESAKEQRLFLLHAIAEGPAPETQAEIGKVILRYADGSTSEASVRLGVDVSSWTSGRSFANAARAWTEYNHNTQVSLFVSQFALQPSKRLSQVTFAANGTCPWMIVAVSAGKEAQLQPIRSHAEPTGKFRSPAPPPKLSRFPIGQKPKNIILVIGDGMGQGATALASAYKYGCDGKAYFQHFPVVGLCSTFSADKAVTDSAASATAFATGTKTSNGIIGLQVDAKHDRAHAVRLVSVAERAHAQGRAVAMLTSDPLYGATPAAFFAHVLSRGDAETICTQAAESGFEILVGAVWTDPWMRSAKNGGKRKDGRDLVDEMTKNGYSFVRSPKEIAAAPQKNKILGSLTTLGEEESLGEAVKAALGRLDGHSEGFFMMAECANTDHACHRNDSSYTVKAVSMVEFMAKAAIDFAVARGDTLVIVTADHDTGHPIVLKGAGQDGRLLAQWTDTSHTRYPVPVYAYGPGAELFEGILDNTDIAKNIARMFK